MIRELITVYTHVLIDVWFLLTKLLTFVAKIAPIHSTYIWISALIKYKYFSWKLGL